MKVEFNDNNTSLDIEVNDWKEAIFKAVGILEDNNKASKEYKYNIIKDVEKYGSYIMIAPKIVIPHTRPENGALDVGFSFVSIKNDVFFPDNNEDPIKVLIAFTSNDNKKHLKMLKVIIKIIEKGLLNNIEKFEELEPNMKMEYLNKLSESEVYNG